MPLPKAAETRGVMSAEQNSEAYCLHLTIFGADSAAFSGGCASLHFNYIKETDSAAFSGGCASLHFNYIKETDSAAFSGGCARGAEGTTRSSPLMVQVPNMGARTHVKLFIFIGAFPL